MNREKSEGGGSLRWLRHDVLSILAIFLALSGTAVAAQAVTSGDAQSAKKKKAKRGPAGPPGPAGSALAFAHVLADGTLDTANSKNVASSVRIVAGYYCVTPVVAVRNFVVSPGSNNTLVSAAAGLEDNFTSCPAGSPDVQTFSGAGLADSDFYIVFN